MPGERPVADPVDFQQIGRKRWHMTTDHPMRYVMGPGFFDGVIHSGIAPEDEVSLIARGDKPATHALIVIDSINNDADARVRASILTQFRRKA